MGGFVFGYQAGVLSGALLSIRRDFGLSSFEQGALVSLLPLGAMVGSLVNGRLADALGRRGTLMVDAVVLMVGTALAAVAPSYAVLLLARAITGVGVGSSSSTVPLYLSEIAPPDRRGRLVTTNQVMIALGIVTSYCVDLIFASSGNWRAMLAVGLLPAAALLLGMARSPETPAWLHAHGRPEQARSVSAEVAGEAAADRLLEGVPRADEDGTTRKHVEALLRSPARSRLVTAVTLAGIQQLSGINAVIYYAPSIMEKTGLNASDSIIYSVIVGAVNAAATVLAFRLVDRLGRRPLLLASLAVMLVSLTMLGLTFVLRNGLSGSVLSLLCLLVYIVAFAVGLGPIFWLLIAEIFPAELRAAGAAVSTAAVWFCNFVVGLAFLPIVAAVGQGPAFWIFAAVCAFGLAFVYRYVPETKGRTFAEIDAEVSSRWHLSRGPAATAAR
jgi:sugar porter (SP) family MFS transporter